MGYGDNMSKHIMSMTYAPKIDAVQDGQCTQTIRTMRKRKIEVGDSILFHGWSGVAYRSKWNKQMRVTVTGVSKCWMSLNGVRLNKNTLVPWNSTIIDTLAMNDFIDPPTGPALRDVLFELNSAPSVPMMYRIIRWEVDWDETAKLREKEE